MNQARQPKGIPVGGQFATGLRAEATGGLHLVGSDAPTTEDFINRRDAFRETVRPHSVVPSSGKIIWADTGEPTDAGEVFAYHRERGAQEAAIRNEFKEHLSNTYCADFGARTRKQILELAMEPNDGTVPGELADDWALMEERVARHAALVQTALVDNRTSGHPTRLCDRCGFKPGQTFDRHEWVCFDCIGPTIVETKDQYGTTTGFDDLGGELPVVVRSAKRGS